MSASKTSDSYADLRVAVATVATSLREAQSILGRLTPAADEQVIKDLDDNVSAACNYLDATEQALATDAGPAVPVVLEFGTFVHEGFDASDQMEELAQVGIAHPALQADTQQLEVSLGKVREAAGQLMLVIQGYVAQHYAASYPAAAQRTRTAAASAGDPPSITGPVASAQPTAPGGKGSLGPSSPPVTPAQAAAAPPEAATAKARPAGRRGKTPLGAIAAGLATPKTRSAASAPRGASAGTASAAAGAATASYRSPRGGSVRSWGSNDLVEAVQGLAVMLASQQSGAPSETSRGAGSYEAVAGQMAATLDAFGLPHDGVQLGYDDNADYARDRLIEGLRRNFASKNRDGFTVYYRVDDPTPANAPASSSQLLRGGALVNAELFGAEVTAFLATLDRLVPRTRFASAIGVFDPAAARRQIKDELQRLTTTIREPLGVNEAQANFQLRRVITDTIEYLELSEILNEDLFGKASTIEDMKELIRAVENGELIAPTSVVRSEELLQDTMELFKLLVAMQERINAVAKGGQKGTQAAQLEQALTAALTSAATFDNLLVRSGTSALEQDLQFVTVSVTYQHATFRVSLRQFLGWVQSTAEPFRRADNRAAGMLAEDLQILEDELEALVATADKFLGRGEMLRFSVRLPAPMRQLQELKYLLTQAADAAEALNQPTGAR